MATVEISNNGAILRITYTVTNNMSTSATYGTSTITINNLEARVTGGGTYYGAKPFYQIQLLKSNGSSIGTYYAFTGNAGSSPAFTLSGSYVSFPEVAGYYTKNKAITVTRSAQSESFIFAVVNNGATARYNHNNGSYYFNGSASFTITDCAYASSTSINSVNNTTTGTATIIILNTPVSSSFTHKLQYKFGSDTSYTDITTLAAGVTTYSWTPTSAVFAPKLTTATSGTCTIRCITYSGSTQVGDIQTKNFTLTLKESDIQLSASVSFSPVWVGTHPSELNSNYVQGKTKVKTDVTNISLKYGATVKSYKYEGLETTTSAASTNTTNSFVGTTQFVAKVTLTDSRGKTWSQSATISPLPYTSLSVSNASAQRADTNTVITSATLTPAIGVSSIPGKNYPAALTITYSESGGSPSSTNNTLGTVKNSSGQNVVFLENKSYIITIKYTDQFGASVSNNFSLPSKAVGMHLRKGNDGVAFGKYSEHSKTLELPEGWGIFSGNRRVIFGNPRNLLDNSDFRNPVNQRGLQEYTSNGYSIDRWMFEKQDNARLVVQQVEDGFPEDRISLQVGSGYADFYQNLENYDKMAGKRYTLAVNIKGVVYAQVFTMGNFTGGISLGNDGAVFYSTPNQHVLIRAMTAPGFNMLWMALYEGEYTAETLPEYRCKGYGAELAECQRYFYKFNPGVNGFYLPCISGTTLIPGFGFPVEMRAVPSMTISVLKTWTDVGITDISSNSISSRRCTKGGLQYIELLTPFSKSGLIVLAADFVADL